MEPFWFNNYDRFEIKQNRRNRQVLNFSYVTQERGKSLHVKVFLNTQVKIPTDFIHPDDADSLEKVIDTLESEEMSAFPVTAYIPKYRFSKENEPCRSERFIRKISSSRFYVFTILVPKEKELMDQLKKARFQTGDFDKLARFNQPPEQKVVLDSEMEQAFRFAHRYRKTKEEQLMPKIDFLLKQIDPKNAYDGTEIVLNATFGIRFTGEFLSEKELQSLVTLYDDIEKPLFKEGEEKKWQRRYRLYQKLKSKLERISAKEGNISLRYDRESRKFSRVQSTGADHVLTTERRIEKVNERISALKERFTQEIEGIGKKCIFDDDLDAKISINSSIWKLEDRSLLHEVYTLHRLPKQIINGFTVIHAASEKELLQKFVQAAHDRNPLIYVAHNLAYDTIQKREAARKTKAGTYDIAVEGIEPTRDFVRKYLQRDRQDIIYLDTNRLAIIAFPWLRSKNPTGDHKLQSVANFLGFPFEKSLNYTEMREREIKALLHPDQAVREKAAEEEISYGVNDTPPLSHILNSQPFFSFFSKLKRLMPYCTLTELAFNPSIATRFREKKHFDLHHNKRRHGYKQKEYENQVEIFKKWFKSFKEQQLKKIGIPDKPAVGEFQNVYQLYLPVEQWLLPAVKKRDPEWSEFVESCKSNPVEHFMSLQYLKFHIREMLVDFRQVLRDQTLAENVLSRYRTSLCKGEFISLFFRQRKEDADRYERCWQNMKNFFRSIYVALPPEQRQMLREEPEHHGQMTFDFTTQEHLSLVRDNYDLYMLRNLAESLGKKLEKKDRATVKRFLTNFSQFEETSSILEKQIGLFKKNIPPADLVYACHQWKRSARRTISFRSAYGIEPLKDRFQPPLQTIILQAYQKLEKELSSTKSKVLLKRGDYLFVTAENPKFTTDIMLSVRTLPVFKPSLGEACDPEELFTTQEAQGGSP